MKYTEWLQQWISLCTATSKESTKEKYEQVIRTHINPCLGEYDLNEINTDILRQFSLNLLASDLASNTLKGIMFVVKASLNVAVKLGFADKNYTEALVSPRSPVTHASALSAHEQKKLEHFIVLHNKSEEFGILFSLYTGVRIGELLALQWNDIDLSKGIAHIHKTSRDVWKNNSYQKCISSPKTAASNRYIPIPKQILPLMRKLYHGNNEAFLFENSRHHCLQTRSYQELFSKILQKLEIPHKGFHSLRHTFATRALECGMDVKTLSEILGHADPSITLKRYAHSMLEHKIAMMNRLGNILSVSL